MRLLPITASIALCAAAILPAAPSAAAGEERQARLSGEVRETERAFAKTMADRDHAAFTRFLSDEAVFFSGPSPLHGKEAVAGWWKRFYEGPQAPFSWEPDKVEVLPSGGLALSSGPVHDPAGKKIGTFTSIWRQEAPGVWKIIFDKGEQACDCAK
ncbi:YybH family protein [Noviherbaspirillum galbum]|uniref:Nuclear transport factor 2 family protein n=1 Tax=Noviherbaspirillum galbum TaxID=2709383 RepID=A0A6B3SRV2_9BURK|nr:nuclear transport factor 2 family protein [Noviherbaspirillum galbum]NEX63483.1 nuclear transport factor 2 family protein [Noviherbaspirillum galbum]